MQIDENNIDIEIKKFNNGFNPYSHIVEKNCEIIFACYSNHTPIAYKHIADESIRHKYVQVSFKGNRKEIFLNESMERYKCLEEVIVEADGGIDFGRISNCGMIYPKNDERIFQDEQKSKKIIRKATEQDIEQYLKNSEEEKYVIEKTRELVKKHNLDMKIIDAEWQFDRLRLTIYFTAPQRIDFRELVKDLARKFKTRIELRQISSREEVKRLGQGVGCCGLELCCNTFLTDFNHITLEHAKVQQLSNNISKLTGNCGRLKCCLLYEYHQYKSVIEQYPPVGSQVITNEGKASIAKIDVYKELAHLTYLDNNKNITISLKELSEYADKGLVIYIEKSDDEQYDEFFEHFEINPED